MLVLLLSAVLAFRLIHLILISANNGKTLCIKKCVLNRSDVYLYHASCELRVASCELVFNEIRLRVAC